MKKKILRWISRFSAGIALFTFIVLCNFILFTYTIMKHIDYELLWVISIVLWFLWLIFIPLGAWKWFFIPLGLTCIGISIAQLYVILFTKDRH